MENKEKIVKDFEDYLSSPPEPIKPKVDKKSMFGSQMSTQTGLNLNIEKKPMFGHNKMFRKAKKEPICAGCRDIISMQDCKICSDNRNVYGDKVYCPFCRNVLFEKNINEIL